MAKRAAKEAPIPEPRWPARFIGEQFATLIGVGVVVAVLSAWVIWDKMFLPDALIPTPLYLYLGFGLGLCGLTAAARYLLADEVEVVNRRRRSIKESLLLLKELARGLRLHRGKLKPAQIEELEAAANELRRASAVGPGGFVGRLRFWFGGLSRAWKGADWPKLPDALVQLDRKLDEHLAFARKSQVREYTESIVAAVLIALLLRAFVVEAFKIPSGSMIPTLQVGDHIFVNKFLYGIRPPWPWEEMEFGRNHPKFLMGVRKPRRGEVIVFKYPKDPDKDFIKRIIGIEGDSVEIRQNQVFINGQPVAHQKVDGAPCEYEDFDEQSGRWEHRRCEAFKETLDGHEYTTIFDRAGQLRSWPPTKVAAGNVFVMGDNRDNSHDSRYWGTVPFELIKGKAMIIWWSSGEPEGIRVKRMGHLVE